MRVVIAYYKLNLKMLRNEIFTLIWSLLLPVIFLILNFNKIHSFYDLRFFWAFIILSCFIYGIGVHAAKLRNEGLLKTYFSIKESRYEFFFSNILTQITLIFFNFLLFNIAASIIFQFNIFQLIYESTLLIVFSIPIAFLSFTLTLITKINATDINTIVSIFMLVSFIALFSTDYNHFNLIRIVGDILIDNTLKDYSLYLIVSICSIILGLFSLKRYSVISLESR